MESEEWLASFSMEEKWQAYVAFDITPWKPTLSAYGNLTDYLEWQATGELVFLDVIASRVYPEKVHLVSKKDSFIEVILNKKMLCSLDEKQRKSEIIDFMNQLDIDYLRMIHLETKKRTYILRIQARFYTIEDTTLSSAENLQGLLNITQWSQAHLTLF
ncbi:hypothetical protein HCA63_17010 [Listeria booriae]|uniref:hypothetical protein n=1 Tax=Listeria booriae TaxID=1552123 RepID=UPI0016256673|nr:hypothetical protein [Listeria booriae]MBC1890059.1 hypothetical protein [Listeria booriae]